jgi:L-seryl-tRNA(Ser) seleniumtransferase
MQPSLRTLPAVHRLLDLAELQEAVAVHGRQPVRDACRAALDSLRARLAAGEAVHGELHDLLVEEVLGRLATTMAGAYTEVINATGVLLHTNLGRAPLNLDQHSSTYLDLEYDLEQGRRGQRLAPLRHRIASVCGAEWAVMVNNNAASLLLVLSAIARDREVIVSRSQLIEIGGSFRLPAVMEASGSRLREVGCTNRTHLHDYAQAIGEHTAAVMVAHQSNFRIVGFTTSPPLHELADLAHHHGLPLVVDQGSGCLHDLRRWGLPHEETVGEILEAGADLVCFSGDKLLGGPQAGLVVGAREWVEPLGRHPLYRALRPDKVALTAMDAVLQAHANHQLHRIPLYAMLDTPVERLKGRAARLGRRLRARQVPARGQTTRAALGGGTTPAETMPSYGLGLDGGQSLLDSLREQCPPVVARIEEDTVVFDLRTVFPAQDRALEEAVASAYHSKVNQDGGA